jgi:hypothetical protein
MSLGTTSRWQADPAQPGRLRWWDGRTWTPLTWPAGPRDPYLDYVDWFVTAAHADDAISGPARTALQSRITSFRAAWYVPGTPEPGRVAPSPPEPGPVTPGAQWGMPYPGASQPGVGYPGAPGAARPGVGHPGAPGAPWPGVGQPGGPGVPQPGWAAAWAQPGAHRPDLSSVDSEPGRVRRWLRAAWASLASDLAVHGLAYLGVLLMFAGLFGLVAFSSAGLRPGFRLLAEMVIPVTVLGAAALLRRHGSAVPARALMLLAGLLLPIVALASLVDGAPVPPDLSGVPLAVALAATCLAIATGCAVAARREPVLRHVVAPAGWLAVAMAALAVRTPVPTGRHIATPDPAQLAAVIAAIGATLAVARLSTLDRTNAVTLPAIPALGVAVLLEALTAGARGWPPVPLAAAAVAAILALDLLDHRLPATAVAIAQTAVTAGSALALAPHIGRGWAGAAAVVAALALTERAALRQSTVDANLPLLALGAVTLPLTVFEPGALLVAALAGTAWAHTRRAFPAPWLPPRPVLTGAAAVLPAVATAALAGWLGAIPATVSASAALAGTALAVTAARTTDPFWSWWLPAAAAAVLAAAVKLPPTPWAVAAACAAVAAVARTPVPTAIRIWTTGAAVLATAAIAAGTWHIPPATMAAAVSTATLLAVLAPVLRPTRPLAQAALLGHATALTAIAVAAAANATSGWPLPVTLAATALGLALTATAQEFTRTAVADLTTDLLAALDQHAHLTPPMTRSGPASWTASPAGAPAADLPAVDPRATDPRAADVAAAGAASAAGAAAPLAAAGRRYGMPATPAAPGGAGAPAEDRLARCVRMAPTALAAVLGAASLLSGLDGSGVLVRTNVWWPVALSALALLYAVGARGLAYLRRTEPARPLSDVASLGALAAALGSGARAPAFAAVAVLAVLPAVVGSSLRRVGAVWVAWAATAPAFVIGAALAHVPGAGWGRALALWGTLLLLGGATAPRLSIVDSVRMLPPRLLGAVGLLVGLVAAPWYESQTAMSLTWLAGGLVLTAAGWLLRIAAGAVLGAVFVFAAALFAGPGWIVLALAVIGGAATVGGWFASGRRRVVCWCAGAGVLGEAWLAGLAWREVPFARMLAASIVLATTLAVLAALGARIGLDRGFATVWYGTGTVVVVTPVTAALGGEIRFSPEWTVPAALAGIALAAALAAAPLRAPWLRDTAALLVVAGGIALAVVTPTTAAEFTWGAAATTLLLGVAALLRPPGWTRPALIAGTATTVLAYGPATAGRALLVPAFLLTAVHLVAVAAARRRPTVLFGVPPALCAAWLAWASTALGGDVQWRTLPAGAALLAMAEIRRWIRHREHRPGNTPDVVALDVTGMALMAAPAAVQAIRTSAGYGLIVAAVGIVCTTCGLLTRVRRRLAGGAAITVGAVLLILVPPLVPLLPQVSALGLWLLLAALGLAAVVAATALDAGRRAVRGSTARLADLTAGWE